MKNQSHTCVYCSLEINYTEKDRTEIGKHYFNLHRVPLKKQFGSISGFIKSYFYNNETPLCICGCGEAMEYFIPGKNCWATLKHGHYVRLPGCNPTRDNPGIAALIGKKVVATKNKRKEEGKIYTSWCKGMKNSGDPRFGKNKGKTLEEICGEEKAKRVKKNLSEKAIQIQSDPILKEKASKRFSEYWGKPVNKTRQSENRTKWIEENNFYTSKLEQKFKEILEKQGILEKHQFRISNSLGNKVYDFKLKNKKFIIEIDGNYWHCNPNKFKTGPVSAKQSSNIENDNLKNFIACVEGYQVYRVWEDEFNHNFDIMFPKLITAYENYKDTDLELLNTHVYTNYEKIEETISESTKQNISVKKIKDFIKKRSEIIFSDLGFNRNKYVFFVESRNQTMLTKFITDLVEFDKRIDYEYINGNKYKCLILNSEI
jgi:very-short-patch-repair endonuclease